MLKYDLAIDGTQMGCISKSMGKTPSETLVEGGRYLQALDNRFEPEIRGTHKFYSFQLIEKTVKSFSKEEFMPSIIEIIIFDLIIGNGDRHQENFAIIYSEPVLQDDTFKIKTRVSPIYDSGSSLGRELHEDRIDKLLNDESALMQYIQKGKAEIHWDEKKVSHFELVQSLLLSSHADTTRTAIQRVSKNFSEPTLSSLIQDVDALVPDSLSTYQLPEQRKAFIHKLITLRIDKLRALIA